MGDGRGYPTNVPEGDLVTKRNGAWGPALLTMFGSFLWRSQQTFDRGQGAIPASILPASLMVTASADGISTATLECFSWGSSNVGAFRVNGRSIGGTRDNPSATPDGSRFFQLSGHGYDTAYLANQPPVQIIGLANGLWSGTNHGTRLQFFTTPNGSIIPAQTATIQDGCIYIGSASPVVGNGALQLDIGATKAAGIGWDASTNLYPTASGALKTDASLATASARFLAVLSVATAAGTTAGAATDDVVVFTGATTQAYTLPACVTGRRLIIKNRSSGTVTINRAGSDTIDGGTTLSLAGGANGSYTLVGNATDWVVV